MEINTNISVLPPVADRLVGGASADLSSGQSAPIAGQRGNTVPPAATNVSIDNVSSGLVTNAASEKAAAAQKAALKAAMDAGTQSLKQISPALEFQIDPDTKQTVVRVVDTTNNEVIKQIPSAEFLRISSAIEGLQKNLLDEKA
jgi:flagellar protein FlaG